jgi:hypothetical protein
MDGLQIFGRIEYPFELDEYMTSPINSKYEHNWTWRTGFLAAAVSTAAGLLYFLVILAALIAGQFTFPPPEWLQLFGGVISLIMCPVLVVMMAALHGVTPAPKQVLSQAGLGFTLLFAMAVSINRFSQLGIVRQAQPVGLGDELLRFQAYGDYSIMLGMEYLGWAWFLGLGLLCAAPLFSNGRLESWIRWLMLLYAGLALLSAVGFLLGSWLALVGFGAWGLVLVIITGLLMAYFNRGEKQNRKF